MFHIVGGGYLNVDADKHRKLLEYLDQNRDDYYDNNFLKVKEYIGGYQQKQVLLQVIVLLSDISL